jgi:hypothetical protein
MTSVLLGFFAGVLHVFAGPDHLAAGMAVRVRRPGGAWYYGGIWALGHAAGLTLIGLVYYLVRESGLVASISLFAERMVGVALILMGAWMLLRRHHPWVQEVDSEGLSSTESGLIDVQGKAETKAAVGFGFLHGTAGATHLIGLIPMFALQNPSEVLFYLIAYNTGILVAMSTFCYFVGVLSSRIEDSGRGPVLGLRIAVSVVCVIIGSYWLLF